MRYATAARETRTVSLSRVSSSASRFSARAHDALSRYCLCLHPACCSMLHTACRPHIATGPRSRALRDTHLLCHSQHAPSAAQVLRLPHSRRRAHRPGEFSPYANAHHPPCFETQQCARVLPAELLAECVLVALGRPGTILRDPRRLLRPPRPRRSCKTCVCGMCNSHGRTAVWVCMAPWDAGCS